MGKPVLVLGVLIGCGEPGVEGIAVLTVIFKIGAVAFGVGVADGADMSVELDFQDWLYWGFQNFGHTYSCVFVKDN